MDDCLPSSLILLFTKVGCFVLFPFDLNCFVLSQWDLPNHHTSQVLHSCTIEKLLLSKDAWSGFITFRPTMQFLKNIEQFCYWKYNKIK